MGLKEALKIFCDNYCSGYGFYGYGYGGYGNGDGYGEKNLDINGMEVIEE